MYAPRIARILLELCILYILDEIICYHHTEFPQKKGRKYGVRLGVGGQKN